ncbi:MAG: long-chain N-acyl amino acid synthase [Nitrosospira sp.]|nr:long-chain N-acyl amino acid synthase [Nitrosospira sp.]
MHLHNSKQRRFRNPYSPSSIQEKGCRSVSVAQQPVDFFEETGEQECILTRGSYSVRLADPQNLGGEISTLIKRMYSWRGYQTESLGASSHNPNQLTLEATVGGHLVGTLTLGIDSEEGLLADELYGKEIDVFRRKGRKVCELTKLAIDSEYSSKEILASLFHLAYIHGHSINGATDLFIEVNPRHAGFYRRMLGLSQVGQERICQRVCAPAVLMHLELNYVGAQIASYAGSCKSGEKSLYPYFFSKHEVMGLAKQLQRHKINQHGVSSTENRVSSN